MKQIVASVPHTGTRFLVDRFDLDMEEHVHTHWEWERQMALIEGHDLLVPLRNPVDVWGSWCRRNEAIVFPYGEFFMAWNGLHLLDTMFELDVICVDKMTDPRISDWGKVGEYERFAPPLPIDLRSVYNLPIVKRHYNRPYMGEPEYNHYYYEDREARDEFQ